MVSRASSATSASTCSARAGLPLGAPPHGPPLPLPADLPGECDGGGVPREPPAVRPRDGDAAHRELAQHLGHRERRAVGLRAQRRSQAGVTDQRVEPVVGKGAQRDVDDAAARADGRERRRRRRGRVRRQDVVCRQVEGRLVGPEGQDGRQAGQPGQRGREEGEAAGIGPLQVVDDEHGAVADGRGEQLDPTGEHERAPGLAVERHVDAVDLGQEDGQRGADTRREPVGQVRVECERLPQHRARQPPGLSPLGKEGAAGEDGKRDVPGRLRHEPRLPRTGDPAERHHLAGADRRAQPGELRVSADEGQAVERPLGRGFPAPTYGAAVSSGHRVPEQRLPQPRRLRRGVDTQLVTQPDPQAVQRGQRPGPVTRRRQRLRVHHGHGLAQRVGRGRVGRVPGRRRRVPHRERSTGRGLQHVDAGPQQALPRRAGPLGVRVLRERFTPEPERGGAVTTRVRRPALAQPLPRLLGQDEELGDVDGARSECVAAGTGHHGLGHGQGPAGARDEHRDVGRGIGGLLVRPQRLGEDLVRHQVGSPHRQHPQQGAHLAPAECRRRHLLAVAAHLEAAEQLQGQSGHGVIVLARRRTARELKSARPSVAARPRRRPPMTTTHPAYEAQDFATPSETRTFPNGRVDLLRIGGAEIGRLTLEPGWRWSTDVRPIAGTEWCEAPHFQYHVAGVLRIRTSDGEEFDARPGQVTTLPSGHDAWVVGDEPVVVIDWWGASHYAK